MTNYSAKHWAIKAEKSAKDAESYASGIDLSNYATKSELESSLEGYAPKNSLNTKADVDLGNTELSDLRNNNGTLTWMGNQILKDGDINTSSFANTDASNFTAEGKETIVGWGMPDYSAGVSLSLTADQTYTATYNQMICAVVDFGTSLNGEILVRTTNDTSSPSNIIFAGRGSNYDWGAYHLYLKKGQSIYVQSLNGTYSCTVYPLIGG